ncbi:FKBP-type peptidyl-prolyl cis-trans isomerase [Candidatus Sumerlaeota bacterium]|nr:FKBP-type peptidyl-prolyl cis-trans isomerase [Candidatus Sumerlaeota bacterium]
MRTKLFVCLCLAAVALIPAGAWAQSPDAPGAAPEFKNDADRLSYAIGTRVGRSMEPYGLDPDAVVQSAYNAMNEKPLEMTNDEITSAIAMLRDKMNGLTPGKQPKDLYTKEEAQLFSVAVGADVGMNLKPLEFETDLFVRGLSDTLASRTLALSKEEIDLVIQKSQRLLDVKVAAARDPQAAKNLAEAKSFLAENAKKDGVRVTETGLQYKILQEGDGPQLKVGDQMDVGYRGYYADGEVFDPGKDPLEMKLSEQGPVLRESEGGLIPGFSEGLTRMKKGSKWQIWIPPDLGYGASGPGAIPPNKMLIFDIELLNVTPPAEAE